MEHFHEAKAGTKAMICNSGEKICISNSSYHMKLMYQNELMVQFLQGNIPLRSLISEETLFISWQSSVIKEVNDLALDISMAMYRYVS